MALYTPAYSRFKSRLPEIDTLSKIAKKETTRSAGPTSLARSNALCRGAIVLLSSHVEGYIEDLGDLALERIHLRRIKRSSLSPKLLFHLSKDIVNDIKNTQDPEKLSNHVGKLFSRDLDIWSGDDFFNSTLDSSIFLHGFANPDYDEIKKFFRGSIYVRDPLTRGVMGRKVRLSIHTA